MAFATVGKAGLTWETFYKLTEETGHPPNVRKLPFPVDGGQQQSLRIEPDFGYFLVTAIAGSAAAASASNRVSLQSGNRNLTDGFVPLSLVIQNTASGTVRALPRPIIIRPTDVFRMNFESAVATPGQFALVGMYPGPDWEPPDDFWETYIHVLSVGSGTGPDRTELSFPYDGLIYDYWFDNPTTNDTLLNTTQVQVFINNSAQPLFENPAIGGLLSNPLGIGSSDMVQTMYPFGDTDRAIFEVTSRTVAEPAEMILRIGKPWWIR